MATLESIVLPLAESRALAEKEYQKRYRTTHREQIRAQKAAYRASHKESISAHDKEYWFAHMAERKKTNQEWKAAHTEHRDAKRVYDREYKKTHRELYCLATAKRLALKYSNTPTEEMLTAPQWREILERYQHRCAYCGCKIDKLTMDHVIPLSKGGKHSADNVVPACAHCNQVKSVRTPEEWGGIHVNN